MAKLVALSPEAGQALEDIQSSCFVLCLDSSQPKTLQGMAEQVWYGEGINRWFDKGVQFVVLGDGRTGAVAEHSASDGGPGMRLNDYVQGFIREFSGAPQEDVTGLDGSQHVTALQFPVTSELSDLITTARSRFQQTTSGETIVAASVDSFGERALSSQMRNANTCVQLIMNLAAYRMYGELKPNYEPVSLTTFADGRWTSCSMVIDEVLNFCRLASHPQSNQPARLDAFTTALKAHGKNVSTTADGLENTEAHLLALKEMLLEHEEMPQLFADPVHQKSQRWFLSASSLPSKHNHYYGFWQVVEDGFGIGHMIRPDK